MVMTDDAIIVLTGTAKDDVFQDVKMLRKTVFINEQGVTIDEEWDDADHHPETLHFCAYQKGTALGCGRVSPAESGQKIGRLAVLKANRQQGIGTRLLRHMLIHCFGYGASPITLHSQTHAVGWYTAFGFKPIGSVFLEAGIEHQKMIFQQHQALSAIYQDSVVRTTHIKQARAHILNLLHECKHTISIISHDLQSPVFQCTAFCTYASEVARRDRNSRVRILVKEPRLLSKGDHPLVLLSRRLPTKVELKIIDTERSEFVSSFINADNEGLAFLENELKGTGFVNFSARAELRQLMVDFEDIWGRYSHIDPNLRVINL